MLSAGRQPAYTMGVNSLGRLWLMVSGHADRQTARPTSNAQLADVYVFALAEKGDIDQMLGGGIRRSLYPPQLILLLCANFPIALRTVVRPSRQVLTSCHTT